MVTSAPDVADLDGVDPDAAAAELAPLFEGAPGFLGRLVAARPFGTWDRLFEAAREIAQAMPQADQVELVDAHPRLGANPAVVSQASFREQGYDRGRTLAGGSGPGAVRDRLLDLNAAYEARFGFRYCVFVAGRPLDALIPELEAALARPVAERDIELDRAIDAVVDIARARHEAG